MKTTALFASLLVVSALVSGCASHGYKSADSAASSVQRAATRVDAGASQVEVGLATLTDLVDNPGADLKPQFSKYNSAVKDVESLSKDIAGKSGAMQKKGSAYFQKWDEELALIQNEDIRSRSTQRKSEVMQGFQRVQANYQTTTRALAPFIAKLTDLRTALSTDLTPAGLEAIRESVTAVKKEGESVAQSLRSLSADFKSLGVSLSPSAPKPSQPSQPQTPAQPQQKQPPPTETPPTGS